MGNWSVSEQLYLGLPESAASQVTYTSLSQNLHIPADAAKRSGHKGTYSLRRSLRLTPAGCCGSTWSGGGLGIAMPMALWWWPTWRPAAHPMATA